MSSAAAPAGPAAAPGPFAASDGRTRLLAATVALVAEQGWAAVDPAAIARAAEVPGPLFYRYFVDTEAAALAAYEGVVDWLGAELAAGAEPPGPGWPLEVRTFVVRALDLLAPHPDLTSFCAWDFPRSGRAALERHRDAVARLAAALRRARAERPRGPELACYREEFAVGGAIWVLGNRVRAAGTDPRLLGPEISYFLLVPYLGTDGARRLAFGEGSSPAVPAR